MAMAMREKMQEKRVVSSGSPFVFVFFLFFLFLLGGEERADAVSRGYGEV
jgi:hypothetical protein